ncbi:hypothetical protein QCA50_001723 [Cerrena zonata]|uniref:WD40 repeat-like protein n=1 Tax=Cerrena zonata TaxID=2478898 RepID=A0AAW0GPH1_9APHY
MLGLGLQQDIQGRHSKQSWHNGTESSTIGLVTAQNTFPWERSSFAFLAHRPKQHINKSPGAVNSIVQSGQYCAIASVTTGGDDIGESEINPYNLEGSLVALNHDEVMTTEGHSIEIQGTTNGVKRYMTVADIQFNPLKPYILASAGYDLCVRFWSCKSIEWGKLPQMHKLQLECSPRKLGYMPNQSLLAIGGDNGTLYLSQYKKKRDVSITPVSRRQMISDFSWGTGSSAGHLLATTCTSDDDELKDPTGVHKLVNAEIGKSVCTLDIADGGHAVTINNTGNYSYIYTKGSLLRHTLWIHDMSQRNSRACQSIQLDVQDQTEVNAITISPDDRYIALAWKHNVIHVYDSQYLSKGPLHVYSHGPSIAAETPYGVVKAQWVSRPSGVVDLVSGGADGCICLWDVSRANDDIRNGQILLQLDDDIGYFSLGDIHKQEMPIVVGTCGGDTFGVK